MRLSQILVPLDTSDLAEAALPIARLSATNSDARLNLVVVSTSLEPDQTRDLYAYLDDVAAVERRFGARSAPACASATLPTRSYAGTRVRHRSDRHGDSRPQRTRSAGRRQRRGPRRPREPGAGSPDAGVNIDRAPADGLSRSTVRPADRSPILGCAARVRSSVEGGPVAGLIVKSRKCGDLCRQLRRPGSTNCRCRRTGREGPARRGNHVCRRRDRSGPDRHEYAPTRRAAPLVAGQRSGRGRARIAAPGPAGPPCRGTEVHRLEVLCIAGGVQWR